MEQRARYEVLHGEESRVPAEPVMLTIVIPPEGTNEEQHTEGMGPPPEYKERADDQVPLLPSYKVATELPSYEEAERTKHHLHQQEFIMEEDDGRQSSSDRFNDMTLGTDGTFILTFVVTFLFNWVGLLMSLCLSHTVAGRYGALSGFGLSLVQWAAMVRHNHWVKGYADANSWVWWVFMGLGFLVFFRGCLQYIAIKYKWRKLSAQAQKRYLLFY